MTAPLLATKLYIPPLRPELVPRPRLIRRLDEGVERKLSLVSAPAGYGKTTLLSEWVHQGGNGVHTSLPVAWLSLDEADNDPTRFLSNLIAAAQSIVPGVGQELLSALQSHEPPPIRSILTSLVNELAAVSGDNDGCCILGLVLDDYHRIQSQEIHDAVAFMLDQLPPPPEGMHLVIATRKDPPLPLPRWRVGAQMADIREADLRFSHEEATAFLTEAMGLELPRDGVSVLESRTEGWIAGLQLAAISMQGLDAEGVARFISAFRGDERHIVDYLVDEVLAQRPLGTKHFLLQTSILERLSGPLCDAVTEGEGGQKVLETLEGAHLFVAPLDNRRQWYRYHQRFAGLLRSRLQAAVGAAGMAALHRRASEWYEAHGSVPEAVPHAFAAGDLTRVADLVEQNAGDLFARSELKILMSWVDGLPDEIVHARPWLCTYYAWALRLTGAGTETVESRLQVAESALKRARALLPRDETQAVEGNIAAIRAHQALHREEEVPRAIGLARQALDNLPEASFARGLAALVLGSASRFDGDLAESTEAFVEARMASMAAGNSYMAVTGTCQLAYTEMLAGQLRKAAQSCREALQMAEGAEGRYLPVAGYALVYLGMAFCEWDNLQAAVRHSIQGIDLCKQVGYVVDQLVGYSTLARAHQAAGDWESAGSACQSAEQLSLRIKGSVYARRWAEECQIRLWSAQGKVSEIARWIEDTDLRTDDEIGFARELEPVILARALVAVGREQGGEPYLDDALDLLARLLEMAESRRWMGKVIEILVLQALAHEFRGETGEALGALQRAMSFAEPEGYVRTFVDEGPAMRRLLTEAVERGIEPDYARRLLTGFEETTADEGRRAEEPLEA